MKMQVTQERLAHALMLVGRVATSRAALPVLANVLLKTEKDGLKLVATNLEIAISQTVNGKIDSTGSLTVPARLFSDYVNSLPSDSIELKTDGNKLLISSGSYNSTINGMPADDFPTLPTIKDGQSFKVDAQEFKTALQQTTLTASSDETRPILTGVFIHTHDKKVYVAATDSYRLSEKRLVSVPKGDFGLVVPAAALGDMLRIIGDENGEVSVKYDDSQVEFVLGDSQLITRQIDGNFPPYRQLIPTESDINLTVNKQEFANIAKVASLFAKESAGSITIEADEAAGKVSITSVASQVGENTSEAEAKVKGSGKVTLNSRYLLDALNVIEGKTVNFRFSGKISPCVITDTEHDDYLHLVMPLKS